MSDSLQPHGLQHSRLLYHQLPEFPQTHIHWVDDTIQPSHPLLSPSPPAFNLSKHQWPSYWSFSISPSNEYSGLISFGIDWFDLLAVQGTLKSLLQHHSLKVSVLWHSAFFMVQFSHPYVTTGKTIVFTRWTFVGNILSRFVIGFLASSKCLLISWLQSLSAMILEPKRIKSVLFPFYAIYLLWRMGSNANDLSILNVEL